jgi:hypothetical protein
MKDKHEEDYCMMVVESIGWRFCLMLDFLPLLLSLFFGRDWGRARAIIFSSGEACM